MVASAMGDKKQITEVVAAIDQIACGMDRLKSLGVIRSRKAYADLAEWLVAQVFGGSLAPCKNQPHWDVACQEGRVQVRSHSKAVDNPNRWSTTKGVYDILVVVVFNESLRVSELYRVPFAEVARLRRPNDRVCWDDLQEWRLRSGDIQIPPILKPLFVQSDAGLR